MNAIKLAVITDKYQCMVGFHRPRPKHAIPCNSWVSINLNLSSSAESSSSSKSSSVVPYLSKMGRSAANDKTYPADISRMFSEIIDTNIAQKPEVTSEKNTAWPVVSFSSFVLFEDSFSTILLLVVGYPGMASHPPLVSLSLTPKPLRCDPSKECTMTIHEKGEEYA